MEGLNRGTSWTVWIDGQSAWTDRQMDGGTNGRTLQSGRMEWTEFTDGRTDPADGRREQADGVDGRMDWTDRVDGQRDGWVDEWTD